ncbi:hypothetical protein [Frankia sp. EAN1pec]|uniref:hypothetical protein n=1 Tax=Parafrankia sp. (strain EAN1pec) TaxID=298653 RepID=UPI0012FC7DE0
MFLDADDPLARTAVEAVRTGDVPGLRRPAATTSPSSTPCWTRAPRSTGSATTT